MNIDIRKKFILILYEQGWFNDFKKSDRRRASKGQCPRGYNIHHIIPRRDGGTNELSNLILIRKTVHETINDYENTCEEDYPQDLEGLTIFGHIPPEDKEQKTQLPFKEFFLKQGGIMEDKPQLKGKYITYIDTEEEEQTLKWYSEEPHHWDFLNFLTEHKCQVIDMGYVMENKYGEYLETYLIQSDIEKLKKQINENKKQR